MFPRMGGVVSMVYGALCTLRSFIFTKLKVHNQSSVDKKICTECHTGRGQCA